MDFTPEEVQQFNARRNAEINAYRQSQAPKVAQPKKSVGGLKGLLAGFLPTVGGAIGAVGGSLVAPVAGTVAGGASGAALGEYLRQRLTGEDQDGIDKGNLVEQGAFGALGALGKARAMSAAAKASKAMTAVNSVDDVANVASATKRIPVKFLEEASMTTPGKATTDVTNKLLINPTVGELADASQSKGVFGELRRFRSTGANSAESVPYAKLTQKTTNVPVSTATKYSEAIQDIPSYKTPIKPTATDAYGVPLPETTSYGSMTTARQRAANALTQKGSGFKVGANVGDVNKMDEAAEVYQRLGIKGAPKTQLKKIDAEMSRLGKEVDDILDAKPIQVNGADVRKKIQDAVDDPNMFTELDLSSKEAQTALKQHIAKFGSAKNAKEINDYVKVVNKTAIRAQDKLSRGLVPTSKEQAALAAKYAGDDVLSQFPEIAPLKKDMSVLFRRNPETANMVGKSSNLPFVGGVLKAPASVARNVESRAGSLLAGGAKTAGEVAPTSFKPFAGQVARQTVSQAVPRMFAAPFMSQPAQEDTSTLEQDIASLNDPTTEVTPTPQPETQQTPFNRSNIEQAIIQDLQSTGGKNVATLSKLYEMFGQTPEPKALNSTSAQTVSDIESGLANIQALGTEYSQSNVNNPIIGKIRSLNPFDTSAQTLQADTARVKQVIGKALEGGVLRKEDEIKYAKILPTISDTEETAQYKINAITEDLRRKLALYKNNLGVGGGGTDIADLTTTQ